MTSKIHPRRVTLVGPLVNGLRNRLGTVEVSGDSLPEVVQWRGLAFRLGEELSSGGVIYTQVALYDASGQDVGP